jgi:ribosomal protein S16
MRAYAHIEPIGVVAPTNLKGTKSMTREINIDEARLRIDNLYGALLTERVERLELEKTAKNKNGGRRCERSRSA